MGIILFQSTIQVDQFHMFFTVSKMGVGRLQRCFFFYNHEEGEGLCSFHRKSISPSRCQLPLSVLKRKKTTRRGKPVEYVCNWARGEYEAGLRAGRRLCSNARLSVSNVISTKSDSLLNCVTHASQVLFGWRFGYTSSWSDFQAIKFGPFPCHMYAWYNLVLSSSRNAKFEGKCKPI